MGRSTRRDFLKRAGLGTTALALAGLTRAEPARAERKRPRAPFKTLYSNDTTNIMSCTSPFHQKGDRFSDDRLRATIDEAKGVDVHMLQPGLGWIPWWHSDIYPAKDHYDSYEREYGIRPSGIGQYMRAGGDVVGTFIDHCRKVGVVPLISYRLNDGHHVRELEEALERGRPSQNMSRFYWENYEKYRIGPDPTDWNQGVFNWAIPEVREHKFALIREICEKYAVAGLELDFMRHWHSFPLDETTADQRRAAMTGFVRRVREMLDRTAAPGRYRWLCVRVPVLVEAHDAQGIDLPMFVDAGVDMVNLSASYFTTQHTDLGEICERIPETPLYLEMTHTTMTGKAISGSGTQPYRRTTDHQFYTTAHLAYTQGAAGVSLFNFVYYREHKMPELGPFNEPPFHVLPKLGDPEWLARQPQWYFLAAARNRPPVEDQPLPVVVPPGKTRQFHLQTAPTEHQRRDGLLRLMAEDPMEEGGWRAAINGVRLASSPPVRKPIDHPYEGYLGVPEQYACFACPRPIIQQGTIKISVTRTQGDPVKLIYLDLVLP